MKKRILCSVLLLTSGFVQAEDLPKMPDINLNAAHQDAAATALNAAQKPAIIDCNYKIPQDTKKIEEFIISVWTAKAVIQVFSFKHDSIDTQLQQLKACFTDLGWEDFKADLQISGNLEAIKSQKSSISSQIGGKIEVKEIEDNQWDVVFPLNVFYQNDKAKVTQKLQIHVNVGRKVSGDLGINNLVAATKPETQPQAAGRKTAPQTPGEATPQKN